MKQSQLLNSQRPTKPWKRQNLSRAKKKFAPDILYEQSLKYTITLLVNTRIKLHMAYYDPNKNLGNLKFAMKPPTILSVLRKILSVSIMHRIGDWLDAEKYKSTTQQRNMYLQPKWLERTISTKKWNSTSPPTSYYKSIW